MSPGRAFGVLLRKELTESWRTLRLGTVVLVFGIAGLLSPVVARYTPEMLRAFMPESLPLTLPDPVIADAIAQYAKNVGGLLTLAAVLLAMGMIATERERGTAAFLFTRSVGRGAFVAAKLATLALILGLADVVAGAAAYGYTAWLFAPPPPLGFAALVVCLWLSHLAIGSLTLAGSAALRSVTAAAAFGVAAYLVLAVLSALPVIGPWTPAGLQAVGVGLADGGAPDGLASLAANLVLIAGGGLAAVAVLRRQEG
jgi:ABC-2 type transport system permease protein